MLLPAAALSRRTVAPRLGRVLTALILWLGVWACSVAAGAEFFARKWTTEDGLPHNNVLKVVQDTQGYLWVATTGGMARFDGRQFREFIPPEDIQPSGFSIRGVAEERPGIMTVLSGGVLARLQGETWSTHPVHSALRIPRDIADFQPGRDGVLWLVRGTSVIRWSDKEPARVLEIGETLGSGLRRRTMVTDGAGNLWIGGGNLIMVRADGSGFQKWPELGPALVGEGQRGRVWVCTADRVSLVENGERALRCDRVPWGDEFVSVRGVYEDVFGTVWIASSRRGVYRMNDGVIENVEPHFASVAHLTGDREGNLWIATLGDGIAELREKPYQIYNTANGLGVDVVSAVDADADGSVWIANRSGGLAVVTPSTGLRICAVRVFANTVAAATDGSVFVGGGMDGVNRWYGAGDAMARMSSPETDPHVLFRASNGDVWFGASSYALGYYRGETVHTLSTAEGMGRYGIQSIAEDPSGMIWIGTREGVLLGWDGKRLRPFEGMRAVDPAPIHAIHADGDGLLWLGTPRGLVVKDGEAVHVLTEKQGLADSLVLGITEDRLGHLWFASRRGLFFVNRAELLDVVRGRLERVVSHPFGRNYGLRGLNPTSNYQPTVTKTPDGRLWFATAQGAICVDPAMLPRDLPVPPVVIDEVRVDDVAVAARDLRVRVPSGQHRIEFRIAALGFTAPEDVLVRHRLDGVDNDWVDTGSDRVASYSSLRPGEYRLRVIARNSAGQWNLEGVTLRLSVVPRWWETAWFRVGAIVLLVTGSGFAARTIAKRRLEARLRRLEQAHALEKERARIARDLHDDLGASLTEVSLVADRLVRSSPPELSSDVSSLAWRTRRLTADLSGIVWTMGATNTSLDRFAAFLVRYVERLFRSTGTRCVVRGADSIPAINVPPGVQHQMIAIARESINNVVKHANATEAVLSMHVQDGVFELSISDNGAGFDVAAVSAAADGNGLRNICARAREIGGSLELTSTPGGGSRVVLRVPLSGSSTR